MLGGGNQHVGRRERPQGGDRAQSERAGADDGEVRSGGQHGGVHAARSRLDHHRGLVTHVVGNAVQLRLMGNQRERPAAAGVGAVARLQARVEVAERRALTAVAVARRTLRAQRLDAARRARQRRLQDDARAVLELADDFVTGHKREADDRLEVPRALAIDCRQVGATDPGEQRPHPPPLRTGQPRRVDVGQAQRSHPGAAARGQGAGNPRRREPRHRPLEHERLHRVLAIGSSGRFAPGARDQSSVCHPRLRAMAASLASGLTATA